MWAHHGSLWVTSSKKRPLLTPTIIRVKEVPSSLHAGAHMDVFPSSLASSQPQIPACLPENKLGISLKYFASTWVPPRGTHSTKTWSLGRSCLEACLTWQLFWEQASMNKGSTQAWHSFPAGLCKPWTKPPLSAQTECWHYTWRALLLGKSDHRAESSGIILSSSTRRILWPLQYLVTCSSWYGVDKSSWAKRGKGNSQNTKDSEWLLHANF